LVDPSLHVGLLLSVVIPFGVLLNAFILDFGFDFPSVASLLLFGLFLLTPVLFFMVMIVFVNFMLYV